MHNDLTSLYERRIYSNPDDYEITATSVQNRNDIRVTAIVSAYSSDRFFGECMIDLFSQTLYRKGLLEILVIDSHSPGCEKDFTLDLIKERSNITYLRTKVREGLCRAWNRGVEMAAGRFLTTANTDDRHRHDALEILSRTLVMDQSCALAYGDFLVTKDENQTFETCSVDSFWQSYEFDPIRQVHFSQNGCQPVWRRSLHSRYGFFDESLKIAGDFDWWMRLIKMERFTHVPELLGIYLDSPTSIEHRDAKLAQAEFTRVRDAYATKYNIEIDYQKYPAITAFPFFFRRSTRQFDVPIRATIILTTSSWSQAEPVIEAIYSINPTHKLEIFFRGVPDCNVKERYSRFSDRLRIRGFRDHQPNDSFLSTLCLALNASSDIVLFAGENCIESIKSIDKFEKFLLEENIDLYQLDNSLKDNTNWQDVAHYTCFSARVFDLLRQAHSFEEVRELLKMILLKANPKLSSELFSTKSAEQYEIGRTV